MPVFAGVVDAAAPPVVEPLVAAALPSESVLSPSVPKTLTWYAPNGDVLILTDYTSGYGQGWGRAGLGAAPIETRWEELPTGGSRFRSQRALSRTLSWPQQVHGSDQTDTEGKWRRLIDAFRHDVGGSWQAGRLVVTHYDGRARYIDAFYAEGLELEETPESWNPQFIVAPLRLVAPDPFFHAADEVVQTIHPAAVATPFYNPAGFYPFSVGSSQYADALTVVNEGDRDTWPTIELTGPANDPVVRNVTRAEQFSFTRAVPAEFTVTIDVQAGTVLGSDGTNWRQYLVFPGTTLWPLSRGANDITVTATGTSVATTITFRHRPRFDKP